MGKSSLRGLETSSTYLFFKFIQLTESFPMMTYLRCFCRMVFELVLLQAQGAPSWYVYKQRLEVKAQESQNSSIFFLLTSQYEVLHVNLLTHSRLHKYGPKPGSQWTFWTTEESVPKSSGNSRLLACSGRKILALERSRPRGVAEDCEILRDSYNVYVYIYIYHIIV